MNWHRPPPSEVWKAIEVYLRHAYAAEPPSAVRARLETLRSVSQEEFYESAVFEHDRSPCPPRYALRLGNQVYPHMKLVIERAPDGKHHLFRADTHDQHITADPGSRDYRAFCQLMARNQELAQAIEADWEQQQLPTFKSFLRADLARRSGQVKTS